MSLPAPCIEIGAVEAVPDLAAVNPAFVKKVDALNLSRRWSEFLPSVGVVYVGDLVQKTEGELLRIPYFGRKALNQVKEVLAEMGLRLGMEVPGWGASIAVSDHKAEYRSSAAFYLVERRDGELFVGDVQVNTADAAGRLTKDTADALHLSNHARLSTCRSCGQHFIGNSTRQGCSERCTKDLVNVAARNAQARRSAGHARLPRLQS